jgi:hypothetical protein
MEYLFATISRDRAYLVMKGKLLLSDALESNQSEDVGPYESPQVPVKADETIVVMGFSPQAKINQYRTPVEDAPEPFRIPKEILNTAEFEITPTAILYYLAELNIKTYTSCFCGTFEEEISTTPLEKRDELWGPYYMSAYRARHWDESSESDHA